MPCGRLTGSAFFSTFRVPQGVEGPEGGGGDATQTAGGPDEAGAEAAGAGQTEGHRGLPVTGGVFFLLLLTLLFCDLNRSTHVSLHCLPTGGRQELCHLGEPGPAHRGSSG